MIIKLTAKRMRKKADSYDRNRERKSITNSYKNLKKQIKKSANVGLRSFHISHVSYAPYNNIEIAFRLFKFKHPDFMLKIDKREDYVDFIIKW